jgi:pimeloyl-ACP methyl ester carboxylesterase
MEGNRMRAIATFAALVSAACCLLATPARAQEDLPWNPPGAPQDAPPVQEEARPAGPAEQAAALQPAALPAAAAASGADPQLLEPLQARKRDFRFRRARPLPPQQVSGYAAAILPYARLAAMAYCDDLYERHHQASDAGCAGLADPAEKGWQSLNTWSSEAGTGQLQLGPPGLGLRLAVFFREEAEHVAVVVAFRGTDFTSWSDWRSNLRWFLRFLGRDQYDQVGESARLVVAHTKLAIEHRLGREVKQWHFVSTGHSLGGGLAQLFAYATPDVRAVVAFDPSPVTGYYSCVSDHAVNCNVPVWRVYERGEVLAYVRAFTRLLLPLSENIVELEFDLLHGHSIIGNHSMPRFLEHLQREVALRPVAREQLARLDRSWPDCHCLRLRRPGLYDAAVQKQCEELAALVLQPEDEAGVAPAQVAQRAPANDPVLEPGY